jgi:hypothetical protein
MATPPVISSNYIIHFVAVTGFSYTSAANFKWNRYIRKISGSREI